MTHPDAAATTTENAGRRPLWRAPLILFLLAAAVYALTATRATVSLDVWSTNFLSWNIATTGVPWVDGVNIPGVDGHELEAVWAQAADNGHRVIMRSPGPVAAGIPAYWLVGGDARLWPGALTAALMTAAAVVLLFLTLRDRLGEKQAMLTAGIFGFTTPVWTVAANGMWPHTVTVLGIAGMAWAARHDRWWLVGVFGGVLLWGRVHAAVIVAVIGLLVALWRRRARVMLVVGVVSTAFLGLLCAWNRWIYGSWSPTSSQNASDFVGYADDNRFSVINHLGFWVSPDRGLFVWTPLLLLLVPPLIRGWRELPDWSRALLIGGVVYTLVQLTFSRFSGGDAFYGYRLGLELLACATPALAMATVNLGTTARRWFPAILALQFLLISTGALADTVFVVAEDVWTDNAFLVATREAPLIAVVRTVAIIAIAWLGARIYANPQIERSQKGGLRSA